MWMMLRRGFASHEMGPQGESQDVGWRGKVKFPLDGFTFTAKDTPNYFRFSFPSHVPLCPEIVVRFTCTRGSLVTGHCLGNYGFNNIGMLLQESGRMMLKRFSTVISILSNQLILPKPQMLTPWYGMTKERVTKVLAMCANGRGFESSCGYSGMRVNLWADSRDPH